MGVFLLLRGMIQTGINAVEERERRLLTQSTKWDARCIIKHRDTRSYPFHIRSLRSSTHKWVLTLGKVQSECILTRNVSADRISHEALTCTLQNRAPQRKRVSLICRYVVKMHICVNCRCRFPWAFKRISGNDNQLLSADSQ